MPKRRSCCAGAVKMEPNNAETIFRLGVVLDKQKKRPQAMEQMRKAIELNDRHARALNYLGYTMVEENQDLDQAERLIRKALAVEPYSGYILDSLGWVYFKRGALQPGLQLPAARGQKAARTTR